MEWKTMRQTIAGRMGMIFVLPLLGGCGVDYAYIFPQIAGQAGILLHSIPLSEAVRSSNLSDEERAKLVLIRDVRNYAGREMSLVTADTYTLFYDGGEGALAYNISASHRHEFRPKKWEFPIIGVIPYLGFFDKAAAVRKFDELQAQGYDVFMYEVDAYSTLAYFPNPVYSPMLRRSDLSLIDTVIHELLHGTVWHAGDTTFNESLATFVGRTGAVEFLADHYPDEPEHLGAALEHYEDVDLYNTFIFELYDELEAFYSSDLTDEEKIARREAVYQAGRERFADVYQPVMNAPQDYDWIVDLPANNAWMLANRRYNYNTDVFAQVYDATGRDWANTIGVFRSAATAKDPNEYLAEWLAEYEELTPALPKHRAGGNSDPGQSTDSPEPIQRGLCPHTSCLVRPIPR